MAQLDTGAGCNKMIRARIEVSGIIQGVGFRPFIYRLASTRGLTGYVANTAAGVIIEADGPEHDLERFVQAITTENPPLASIDKLHVEKSEINPAENHSSFEIHESISSGTRIGPITPDTDVCDNCLAELFNTDDRRYLYPFINCTDCGPRYTLIEKTPYDRPQTSMKHFPMCEQCRAEYIDPLDRRFHAQATCCPLCGPSVRLTDSNGQTLDSANPLQMAADFLKSGKIVAIKGIGGFHLAVNSTAPEAIASLRKKKGRPDKPLAVMAASLEKIRSFACISLEEQELLTGRSKPIVLLQKESPFSLAENVAPANRFIGAMLPYTPIHHLLLEYNDFLALVMTSGNLSGCPIVKDNDDAFEKLANIADYFLLHNRPIVTQTDDSVIRLDGSYSAIYRRARAFVPTAVTLKENRGRTLALGAIIKNTICLTKGKEAFLSQHIGDLDNIDTQLHQKNITGHFQSLMRVEPGLLVHDLHPDYPGTRYALNQKELPTIGIQHHHAHAVSCMVEHGLDGPVIGLTLDGNGYGPDNSVWGGEVLLADYHTFERLAHLSNVEMPGGDAAIQEPWRMAVSHLYRAYGPEYRDLNLPILQDHADKIALIEQMIDKSINSPLTSSCGRLFDAAAALLGLRHTVSFEGQAAAELEMLLGPNYTDSSSYPFEIIKTEDSPWILPVKSIIVGIVNDIQENIPPQLISKKFHNTLAALFTRVCREIRDERNINTVVLSGGVFQNLNLLRLIKTGLEILSFDVYAHEKVPTNDGGLSLGQAVAGRALYEKNKGSRIQGEEL
ncbi:carbamoyltransferase HypF [Thermodesulfobacteriota bacterium]